MITLTQKHLERIILDAIAFGTQMHWTNTDEFQHQVDVHTNDAIELMQEEIDGKSFLCKCSERYWIGENPVCPKCKLERSFSSEYVESYLQTPHIEEFGLISLDDWNKLSNRVTTINESDVKIDIENIVIGYPEPSDEV